jgi:K+-transporting ATPase ATPase B chain
VLSRGEFIPWDGEVVEAASVDESAITGIRARDSRIGRNRPPSLAAHACYPTRSRACLEPGKTPQPDDKAGGRSIASKTPNEIALNILLAGLTIIFLMAVVTLQPFAIYSGAPQTVFVLVSLLVCLIPTTIGGLLSAIGMRAWTA